MHNSYSSPTLAGDAIRYRNLMCRASVSSKLPAPLADIVSDYSFADPRIAEVIVRGLPYGRTKTTITRPGDGEWEINFHSGNNDHVITVEILRISDRYPGIKGYRILPNDMYEFLYDGKRCTICDYKDDIIINDDIEIISETREWNDRAILAYAEQLAKGQQN